ncbi:ABC transporter permease [Brassicibacter mesophilus]|uniref:ABC transporter permease n=1 Tax=Brassicibacter mesophilus TaxID=745119 RepID=UPI003D1D2EEC
MKIHFERKYVVLFLFIFSLLLCQSIYIYIEEINSTTGYEKLIIGLKEGIPIENGMSVDEVEALNRAVSPQMSTYYATDESVVTSDYGAFQAQVYGVLGNFNEFSKVELNNGSFINDNDNNSNNYVVVIEDTIAQKIFKSENVIGLNMNIYNEKFEIIGVVSSEGAIMEKMLNKELPHIYIPLNTMKDINSNTYIGNIEYKNNDSYFDKAFMLDKIELVGKNSNNYFVEDLNITGIQQKQKYDILIFILGAYCLYRLLKVLFSIIKSMHNYFKDSIKKDYLTDALKIGKLRYMKGLIMIAGIVLLGVFIWKEISFSLYIAPEKIPDNPGSISQHFLVLKEYLFDFVNFDYIHPLYKIKLSRFLQRVNNIVFLIGIVCELYLILYVIKDKSNEIKDKINRFLNLGIYLVVSVLLSAFLLYLSGLPVLLSAVDIVLIWICFTVILLPYKEEYLKLLYNINHYTNKIYKSESKNIN